MIDLKQADTAAKQATEKSPMRTELHPWEKAVLSPPNPGDFGIPKEHWDKAQYYANYWHENRVAAQRPSSFAGLTLTEVRVPFGMTVRFEGGSLIIEAKLKERNT
jgi:hypothetical protein